MRETERGFLEIHQENEQKPSDKKSRAQTGSTSGPQPDLAHELGKGTRMSAWEVTRPHSQAGDSQGPCPVGGDTTCCVENLCLL